MKNILKISFLCIASFCACSVYGQVTWIGDGDGTSWNDGSNWSTGMVPSVSDTVEINQDATITGVFEASPRRLRVGGSSNVQFQLDMDIDNETAGDHGLIVGRKCTVEFGSDSIAYRFNFNTASNRNGLLANNSSDSVSIVVMRAATLNFGKHNNAVNITAPTSQLINNGTITIGELANTGIRISGEMINNGQIEIASTMSDGIQVRGGSFTNGMDGTISISQCSDDGIEVIDGGMFTNAGVLTSIAQDSAGTNNNAIAVGTADASGSFLNDSTGEINADGGVSSDARAISVYEVGDFSNIGSISAQGGNSGSTIYTRNELINDTNGYINLNDGRINANIGSLINNGFIESTRGGSGIFSTVDAVVVNNGFFRYENSGQFASGDGAVTDNGISLNNIFRLKLDAEGECQVDFANVAYDWTIDGTYYNSSGDDGSFTFLPNSLAADSVVLRTTLPKVNIKVVNICSEAVMTTSVDEVQVGTIADVFPSPLSSGDHLNIHLKQAVEADAVIYDLHGRVVLQTHLVGQSHISTAGWSAGKYFLRILQEDKVSMTSILVH